jgi:hypothetical protein
MAVEQLYLDGAAWAEWGDGLRTYLEGDPDGGDRLELVPVINGVAQPASAIGFVHDANVATVDAEVVSGKAATMIAYVGVELALRSVYDYASQRWTVAEVETDRAGSASAAFPYRATLVRHAK